MACITDNLRSYEVMQVYKEGKTQLNSVLGNYDHMAKPKVGDVFEKTINGKVFTMHYVLLHPDFGPYARVFKGASTREDDLVIDKIGLGINPAVSKGGWEKIGFENPGTVTLGPILYFEPPYPDDWYLIEGNDLKSAKLFGKEVPSQLRSLEVTGTSNYLVLSKRLETGINEYSYEKWMEYKRLYGR